MIDVSRTVRLRILLVALTIVVTTLGSRTALAEPAGEKRLNFVIILVDDK